MFKVKNSKVINRISTRSLKNSRMRNIIAIAAIILTCIMFTTVFSVGASIIEAFQLSTMRQVGTSSHAGFKFLTWDQYEKVAADPKVKDISYNIIIGFGENPELNKTYTEIRYTEEKDAEWSFSTPTTGTLPKERLDIATSTNVLDALGVSHEIGAAVPLEFTANGIKYKETFTLCGFWEQDAVMAANQAYLSKEYCDEVAPVWRDNADSSQYDMSNYSGCVNPSLWFSSSWDIEAQMQALKERCGFGPEVNEGINWAYTSSKVDASSILLIGGLLLIIMLSGYLIIYNIFYISVNNEVRLYGLLKTIGTTGKQLRRIVRRQALLLSAIGIPIGLALGYFLSVLLLPVVISLTLVSDYSISVNPLIFIGSAIFTLIIVVLSCMKPCRLVSRISAVEAVRYTSVQSESHGKKGRKKKKEIKKEIKKSRKVTPYTMAVSNIGRTSGKTVSVVLSISLSLLLLNGTVTLVKGFDMDKYIQQYLVSDFYISDASVINLMSSDKIYNGVNSDLRELITSLDGVTETGNVYMKEYVHTMDKTRMENVFYECEEFIDTYPEIYDSILPKVEMGNISSHIYGVDGLVMDKLELTEGKFDKELFMSGDYVIVSTLTDTGKGHFYEVGDKVTITLENGIQKEYTVMALGDVPYALGPQHSHIFDVYFTVYSEEFIRLTGETGALKTAFNVSPDKCDEMEQYIENYCENINSDLDYRSRQIYENEFRNMENTFMIVGSALSFILAMIGILNFANAFITSIQTRRHELAVLQSIGMTGSQLKRMLIGEGLCYIIITFIFTVTAGNLISGWLIRSIAEDMWYFTYHFTISPLLLSIPPIAAVSAIIPAICYRYICRQSVVDRLRESES